MEIPPLPEEKARQIKSDTEAGGKIKEDPGSTGKRTQDHITSGENQDPVVEAFQHW